MAKESKTIQVYPDDNVINRAVEIYNCFGWELTGNQTYQVYSGQSVDLFDLVCDTVTNNYTTYCKLTFSREKSSEWYFKVVELERKYYNLQDQINNIKAKHNKESLFWKSLKMWRICINFILTIFTCGIYLFIRKAVLNSLRNKKEAKIQKEIQPLTNQQKELLVLSDNIVNGRM